MTYVRLDLSKVPLLTKKILQEYHTITILQSTMNIMNITVIKRYFVHFFFYG